jgi:hypothetical protein
MNFGKKSQVQEAITSAIILRCACGNPLSHEGEQCPNPSIEDLGTIAYYNKNPMKLLIWNLKHKLRIKQ